MIDVDGFFEVLAELGVDAFTGVPDSILGGMFAHLQGRVRGYIAAPDEGSAVAIAVGAHLAGATPAVLMQNSGLGNAVNPIMSLARPFGVPLLFFIGYRGEGGEGPPQHRLMGPATAPLLELMGIPAVTLPADLEGAAASVRTAVERMREDGRSRALLVRRGLFEGEATFPPRVSRVRVLDPPQIEPVAVFEPLVTRRTILEAVCGALTPDDLVIAATGYTARALADIEDRDGNFYMVGSMGCAAAIGLGIASQEVGRKIIVLDGDGAVLMRMGLLSTLGHYRPAGLLHVVLDNGTYDSTGGQPTTATTVDFPALARACGIGEVRSCSAPEAVADVVAGFDPTSPTTHLTVPIHNARGVAPPRAPSDLEALRERFCAFARTP